MKLSEAPKKRPDLVQKAKTTCKDLESFKRFLSANDIIADSENEIRDCFKVISKVDEEDLGQVAGGHGDGNTVNFSKQK
ncbi:MAG: hypothetical protein LBF33_02790 [Oscillospiraceae bacterium]|jgi:hypothetical protein|nr:hypothetical protein [Oscillospiraceae bacterium]